MPPPPTLGTNANASANHYVNDVVNHYANAMLTPLYPAVRAEEKVAWAHCAGLYPYCAVCPRPPLRLPAVVPSVEGLKICAPLASTMRVRGTRRLTQKGFFFSSYAAFPLSVFLCFLCKLRSDIESWMVASCSKMLLKLVHFIFSHFVKTNVASSWRCEVKTSLLPNNSLFTVQHSISDYPYL